MLARGQRSRPCGRAATSRSISRRRFRGRRRGRAAGRLGCDSRRRSIGWRPGAGWNARAAARRSAHALIDLYLPICSATAARPITVGHLGQSLDGFIATHAGESQYVTGEENILHLHRMRALCDAVVVGAGTVAADDPQLTTRHVSGPSPLRVVLDPTRRLADHYRVFNDDSADTLYVCARSLRARGRNAFRPRDDGGGRRQRAPASTSPRCCGCCARAAATAIFVEGGGVTVSMFLEANLLDRLHIAIAPLIIGDGRPAIRLPPRTALSDCHRPRYRVFRMGARRAVRLRARPGRDRRHRAARRRAADHARYLTRVARIGVGSAFLDAPSQSHAARS